ILVGEVGDALVDDAGSAVAQRPVDDIAVPGDPADVGGAPVHRVGLDVEDVVMGRRRPHQIPRGGVDDALGFGGGPTRIEQVEQVLGVHLLAGAGRRIGTSAFDQV